MKAAVPTEDEAREASRIVDAYLDDRPGVTLKAAQAALRIVQAWSRQRRQRREGDQAARRAS